MTHNHSIHEVDAEEKSPPQNCTAHAAQPLHHNIRILTLHETAGGNLRAFVDIGLGAHLIIKGFRVIQQAGQRAWVSPPQQEYTGDDGQRRYAPIVELTGDLRRAVEQAILAAWEGGAQ